MAEPGPMPLSYEARFFPQQFINGEFGNSCRTGGMADNQKNSLLTPRVIAY